MKKSLSLLALLGVFASAAQAQSSSSVIIYGQMDVGVTKSTNSTTDINAGDNNKLGFKGTEDLGNGLAATFQIESRFDPDTGFNEGRALGGSKTRPLFQGSTQIGLNGGFGSVKLGRGLTAKQDYIAYFDPWESTRNRGAFAPDVMDAGYVSDPLNTTNTSQNRWSNAAFYQTPDMSGFTAALTLATKSALDEGTPSSVPVSVAGMYRNGPVGALLAYERNAIGNKIAQGAVSYDFGVANLMASYSKTTADADYSQLNAKVISEGYGGYDAKAWTVGAKIPAGVGRVLVGYGQQKFDDTYGKIKKAAIGYEHPLSKRTFLYVDAINRKADGFDSINTYDLGVNHKF